MAEIIQQWLRDRLGCIFRVNSDRFLEVTKSGALIANILYSYGLFSEDQVNAVVDGTMDQKEVFTAYLAKINVHYNTCIHEHITAGNISTAIKLLYNMYLALQSKDKLHHVAIAQRKRLMTTINKKFSVTPVCDEAKSVPEQEVHYFSKPLKDLEHIVEWHKERHKKFLVQCQENREQYIAYLNDKITQNNPDLSKTTKIPMPNLSISKEVDNFDMSSVDLDYGQLIEEQSRYEAMEVLKPNPVRAKKIVSNIRSKVRKKHQTVATGIQMKKLLLTELWDEILQKQYDMYEETIINKVLKQSTFEKQMVTKAFEVRQQKQIMYDNRYNIDSEVIKQRDEEFCQGLFHDEVKNQEKEYMYYLEKRRALELHHRLFEERKRLRSIKINNVCNKIVQDLVDVALYAGEYMEKYGVPNTTLQRLYLKALFIHEKPIFDLLNPIEDILNYDPEECPEDMEEIYRIELSRHDTILKQLFEDYVRQAGPWNINIEDYFTADDLDQFYLSIYVLGYIVHRLLLAKYPRPEPPPAPDIPNVTVAACINGLVNMAILPALKQLLQERRIQVIEMNDAINYCLAVFKEETTVDYLDSLMDQEDKLLADEIEHKEKGKKGKKDKDKKGKSGSKEKPLKLGQKKSAKKKKPETVSSADVAPGKEVHTFQNKSVQTPKLMPWEEAVLSPAGELGRQAYYALNLGDEFSDDLIVSTFIQYLISLKDKNIGGWVLVNYPNTMQGAAILEERLSSIKIPNLNKYEAKNTPVLEDYVEIEDQRNETPDMSPEEELELKRCSRILPNPKPTIFSEYNSYLSAFIRLEQIEDEAAFDYDTYIETRPTEPLQAFYYDQGSKYDLFIKIWDFKTLKLLGKLIMGDYTLPRKTSVEILGPSVEYLEAVLEIPTGIGLQATVRKGGSKKEVSKKQSKKSKDKSTKTDTNEKSSDKKQGGKKGGKKGEKKSKDTKSTKIDKSSKKSSNKGKKGKASAANLPIVVHEEKATQIPEDVEEKEASVEEKVIRPGEDGWAYVNCSIPVEYQCALATLWENMEEIYSEDLKALFFRRRIILDNIIPYISYTRKHMHTFITRPDTKQKHLHDFQTLYNQIDLDLRDDDELKAEVHCRIFEFRNKLYDICDQRMIENEQERQRLIEDNWTVKCLIEIINCGINIMQVEINAQADILTFILEYYNAMVTKMPAFDTKISKFYLQKIAYDEEESPDNAIANIISYTDQLLKSKRFVPEKETTPFEEEYEKRYQAAIDFATETYNYVTQVHNKLASIFKPKEASKKEKKPKSPKNKSKKDPKKMPTLLTPEPDVIQVADDLIEEYRSILEGMMLRIRIRLHVVLTTGRTLINSVLKRNKTAFLEIYNSIEERYRREKDSIDIACSILSRAVEAECVIQPQLLLIGDEFLVEPDHLLFNDPLPQPEGVQHEIDPRYMFSIKQLQELYDMFNMFAPNGFIIERAFTYLLQDMVVHNAEDGKVSLVPWIWKQLKPEGVNRLIVEMFGCVEYIDWRDFLLYNLGINFPNVNEIIHMRNAFRKMDPDDTECVYQHQYLRFTFWFDLPDYDTDTLLDVDVISKRAMIKQLLWNLFKVDENKLNYTALLLALCKDTNPVVGLGKALSLSYGKEICRTNELGELHISKELEKRRKIAWEAEAKRIDHEDTIQVTEDIVDKLTENVLHECDSQRVIIEEIEAMISDNIPAAEVIISGETIEDEPSDSVFMNIDTDTTFSNIEIGFEEAEYQHFLYILPFEGIMTVLASVLPWKFSIQGVGDSCFREQIEELYNKLKITELGNAVYVHRFLNSDELKELLKNVSKFTVKYPAHIVVEIIGTC